MALVFALVGIEQWINRDIFWNPKLLVGNTYAPFFRVNSVFWDPSIYGRFLVVAILASLVVALFSRSPRAVIAALIAIAAMWIGLLFSFSQSSFIALIAGARRGHRATPGAGGRSFPWAWPPRSFLVAVVAAPNVRHAVTNHADGGLNRVTSGRSKLVSNGVKIAIHHPVVGVGIGGFKHAYAKQAGLRGKEPAAAASHDTPITVAAETGIVGIALFVWLLVAGFLFTFRRAGARPRGDGRARLRARARLDRRAQPVLQRVLRGPDRLGRARAGRGRLAAAEGPAQAAGLSGRA